MAEDKPVVGCRKIYTSLPKEQRIVRQCAYSGPPSAHGLKKTGSEVDPQPHPLPATHEAWGQPWQGVIRYFYQCEASFCNGAAPFGLPALLGLACLALAALGR